MTTGDGTSDAGGQPMFYRPVFLIGFAADEATAEAEMTEYGYFTVNSTPDRDHQRPVYAEMHGRPPAASVTDEMRAHGFDEHEDLTPEGPR